VEVVRARGDDHVYLSIMDVDALLKLVRIGQNRNT
jgi:hypothetical protein